MTTLTDEERAENICAVLDLPAIASFVTEFEQVRQSERDRLASLGGDVEALAKKLYAAAVMPFQPHAWSEINDITRRDLLNIARFVASLIGAEREKRPIDYLGCVAEFHERFGVPTLTRPALPDAGRQQLRIALIEEEFTELRLAIVAADLVEIADALGDLMYVVAGSALEFGIPLDAVYREIHRSNMTKVWSDGTVHHREDGKVIKPPTYSPANIAGVLALPAPPAEAETKESGGMKAAATGTREGS